MSIHAVIATNAWSKARADTASMRAFADERWVRVNKAAPRVEWSDIRVAMAFRGAAGMRDSSKPRWPDQLC